MRTLSLILISILLSTGCDDGPSGDGGTMNFGDQSLMEAGPGPEAGPNDSGADARTGPDVAVRPSDGGPLPDSAPVDAGLGMLTTPIFSQAIDGAFFANPDLFGAIPIRLHAPGAAQVVMTVDRQEVVAQRDGAGWAATVDISALADGEYRIQVTATAGRGVLSAQAQLHIVREGLQFTDYRTDGSARTPRLHRVGDALYATWGDSSTTPRCGWFQRVDGAGRRQGEPLRITPEGVDALATRVMVGGGHLGVLYQVPDNPYRNYLTILDFQGNVVVAPIALDSGARDGSYGGDITFDGTAFIAIWREAYGRNDSEIKWIRVVSESGEIIGPVVVTAAGDGDPIGSFLPFTMLRVEAMGQRSLVTFNRDYMDPVLDVEVQRNYAVFVSAAGEVGQETFLPTPGLAFPFGFQAHVHRVRDDFVVFWVATDLGEDDNNAAHRIFGSRVAADTALAPNRFETRLMVSAPDARGEPFVVGSEDGYGLMLWTDNRSKAADLLNGMIELTYAPVGNDFSVGEPRTVPHARFVEGNAQLRGIQAGSNTILSWIDERHGSGVAGPKPEVYFETIWR